MFLVRWFAGFTVAAAAVALAVRGDWAAASVAAAAVLVPVVWRVRRELLATRAMMCGPVPGKHRRSGRPRELRQVTTGL